VREHITMTWPGCPGTAPALQGGLCVWQSLPIFDVTFLIQANHVNRVRMIRPRPRPTGLAAKGTRSAMTDETPVVLHTCHALTWR
jgi:hypothetical protein